MGDTTYQEMTIDYLGDMATEYDLQYFQSACEAYQSRTGCSDREAPDYIWGDGDWLQRGYEEIGDFARYVNEHCDPVTYEYCLEADAIRNKQQLEEEGWDVGAPFYKPHPRISDPNSIYFLKGTWNITLFGLAYNPYTEQGMKNNAKGGA